MTTKHIVVLLYLPHHYSDDFHITIASNKECETKKISEYITKIKELVLENLMDRPVTCHLNFSDMKFGINRPVLAHAISFACAEQENIIKKIAAVILDKHPEKIYHITTKTTSAHSELEKFPCLNLSRLVVKESGHKKTLLSLFFSF